MKTASGQRPICTTYAQKGEKKKRSNSHDFYQGTASGTDNCSICITILKHLKEKLPSTKI